MYRVMLADDEGIVIDSLKFIIEKEFGDPVCKNRKKCDRTGRKLPAGYCDHGYPDAGDQWNRCHEGDPEDKWQHGIYRYVGL